MVKAVLCCKEFVRGEHISTIVCLFYLSAVLEIESVWHKSLKYFYLWQLNQFYFESFFLCPIYRLLRL